MKQAKKLESLKSNVFTSASSVLGGCSCVTGYGIPSFPSIGNTEVSKGLTKYQIDTLTNGAPKGRV